MTRARRLALTACLLGIAAPRPAHAQEPAPEPAPAPAEPPALAIAGYTLTGELSESVASLRRVLDAQLAAGEAWSPVRKAELVKFLARLQYRLVRLETRVERRTIHLTLGLAPFTLIRRVTVDGNWPVLEEDVVRRMTLRAGTAVPDDPAERIAQLDKERDRLTSFLYRQGYFEARVVVAAEQAPGSHEAIIRVKLAKGPSYTIGKVDVEGNTDVAITDDDILKKIRHRGLLFWKPTSYSQDQLDDDLARIEGMLQRAGYPRARVRQRRDPSEFLDRKRKRVRFTLDVDEHKKIDVALEGQKNVGDSRLLAAVTFAKERSYDDVEVQNSADALRRTYQENGFFQAVVTAARIRLLPSYERVIFSIIEGPRLPVRRIGFAGNRAFTSGQLRGRISTKELPGGVARYLESGGYLTTAQLEQDRETIRTLYQQAGYSTVKVDAAVATDPRLLHDVGALAAATAADFRKGGLYVHFTIEEGPRDTAGKILFVGNHAVNDADLERVTRLRRGAAFTDVAMADDQERIGRLYAELGYPYAVVEWAPSPGAEENVFDVKYTITEGKLARFGELLVRGNFKTRDWVIADALGFKRGEPFTVGRLAAAQRGLRETRLFSSMRLDRFGLDPDARRDDVDVLVAVQESHDNLAEGEFGLGWSTDNSLFGSALVAGRNVGGIGASIAGRGELGFVRQFFEVNVALPHWILRRYVNRRVPLRFDQTFSILAEDHERFGRLVSEELRSTLSRRFSDRWQIGLSYAWRAFQRNEDLVRPSGADEGHDKTVVETTTASLSTSLVYDKRSDASGNFNPLNPTRGYRVTGSFGWASRRLGGTDDFFKLGATAQWYVPLGARFLLTNGIRYDQGIPLEGSVLLPEVERFFAGGDTTVRGVERDRLNTEVIRNPLYPGSELTQFKVVPAGGNIRALYNIDLQLKVWGPFASALFFDTGLVTNSFDGFGPRQFRHSVGAALVRLVLPFGSFSFEYGIPLDPAVGDSPSGRLHVNAGFVF